MNHYNYHSFPRRWRNERECDDKGLEILASIVRSGFLLTPERVQWPGEFKKEGRVSEGPISYNRRVCFTYLVPGELRDHAHEFGPFSIEFENWQLRTLGGIPVIYLPIEAEYRGYLGVGIALASRLTDFQLLLERLKLFLEMCESSKDKFATFICAPAPGGGILVGPGTTGGRMIEFSKEHLQAIKAGNPSFEIPDPKGPVTWGGNIGCIESLLQMLTWGIQSYDIQLGNMQAFAGYFYPSERLGQGDLLSYYRQREWRILGSMTREGVLATRSLNASERARLIALDQAFFSRSIPQRDGKNPEIVDECVYLSEVDGRQILTYARRIVCPVSAKSRAEALLRDAGFTDLPVADLESIGSVG